MKAATIIDVFSKYLAGISQVSEKSRALLLADANRRLAGRELDGDDCNPFKQSLHFQQLRADLVRENWRVLDPEERIYLLFPAYPKIGDELEIPKRGRGTIMRRELTKRLGLEITFRMSDGNRFVWEYFD
jgi:hypothetical protein